jgi:hypothetical protein
MEASTKYPRTHHLPWSDTIGPDGDHVLRDLSVFTGHEIVVTEKLDGENTTLYRTHLHARSLDGRHHPSRGWVKGFHARVASQIPSGWRVCGESLYALHSIPYHELPSYYVVFGVHNGAHFLSWDDTIAFCKSVLDPLDNAPLMTPPVLYRGLWNEKKVKDCFSGRSAFGGAQEGYVVRRSDAFGQQDFGQCIAKYVRPNHIQTDRHWMLKPVVKNELASGTGKIGNE